MCLIFPFLLLYLWSSLAARQRRRKDKDTRETRYKRYKRIRTTYKTEPVTGMLSPLLFTPDQLAIAFLFLYGLVLIFASLSLVVLIISFRSSSCLVPPSLLPYLPSGERWSEIDKGEGGTRRRTKRKTKNKGPDTASKLIILSCGLEAVSILCSYSYSY